MRECSNVDSAQRQRPSRNALCRTNVYGVPAGLSDERCRSKHWGGSGNTLSFLSKHEQIHHSTIQSRCAGTVRVSSAAVTTLKLF